jgi:hypothetical protein
LWPARRRPRGRGVFAVAHALHAGAGEDVAAVAPDGTHEPVHVEERVELRLAGDAKRGPVRQRARKAGAAHPEPRALAGLVLLLEVEVLVLRRLEEVAVEAFEPARDPFPAADGLNLVDGGAVAFDREP